MTAARIAATIPASPIARADPDSMLERVLQHRRQREADRQQSHRRDARSYGPLAKQGADLARGQHLRDLAGEEHLEASERQRDDRAQGQDGCDVAVDARSEVADAGDVVQVARDVQDDRGDGDHRARAHAFRRPQPRDEAPRARRAHGAGRAAVETTQRP